jgi:hypothetical protein
MRQEESKSLHDEVGLLEVASDRLGNDSPAIGCDVPLFPQHLTRTHVVNGSSDSNGGVSVISTVQLPELKTTLFGPSEWDCAMVSAFQSDQTRRLKSETKMCNLENNELGGIRCELSGQTNNT